MCVSAQVGAIFTYLQQLHMSLPGRAASLAVGVLLALPFVPQQQGHQQQDSQPWQAAAGEMFVTGHCSQR